MFRGLIIAVGRLFADLSQHRSPLRIATGVALGTSLGFLPIDNLVWFLLVVAVLFLPVHQLSAVAAWFTTSCFGSQVSVIPDALGAWILSLKGVQWFVVQSHAIPWSAWLRLNNTLVVGSLACGFSMLVPNWIALRMLAGLPKRQAADSLDELEHIAGPYRKIPSSSSHPKTPHEPVPSAALAGAVPLPEIVAPSVISSSTVHAAMQTNSPGPTITLRVDPPHASPASDSTTDDESIEQVTLRETFIEVVRLRATQSPLSSPIHDRNDAMLLESKTPTDSATDSPMMSRQCQSTAEATIDSVVTRYSPAHHPLSGPKSSSSLRFLLRHLKSNHRSPDRAETQA